MFIYYKSNDTQNVTTSWFFSELIILFSASDHKAFLLHKLIEQRIYCFQFIAEEFCKSGVRQYRTPLYILWNERGTHLAHIIFKPYKNTHYLSNPSHSNVQRAQKEQPKTLESRDISSRRQIPVAQVYQHYVGVEGLGLSCYLCLC